MEIQKEIPEDLEFPDYQIFLDTGIPLWISYRRTVGKIVTARHPRTRYAVGFMAGPLIAARRVLPDRVFDLLIGAAFGFRR